MAKFLELNQNINDVLLTLIQSQNLCKYLFYETDENSPSDPIANPDLTLTERQSLIYDRIFPYPKIPETVDSGSYVTVYLDNIEKGASYFWKEATLTFNVICHFNQFRIEDKLKPYAIMHEIDALFNRRGNLGIGRLQFEKSKFVSLNSAFGAYTLEYKITDFN